MTIFCAQCEATADAGAVVCIHCGSDLGRPAPASPAPPSVPATTGSFFALSASQLAPSPQARTTVNPGRNRLNGIGGWLLLIGVNLVVGPFYRLHHIITSNIPSIFAEEYQTYLSNHHASAALILFELIQSTSIFALLIVLNFLFFTRKKAFPAFMIFSLATMMASELFDHIASHLLHPARSIWNGPRGLISSLVACCIWIPYFVVSRRVKATFIR
jgi:hypothetical protein